MESLKKFKNCDEWKKNKGEFIPHPTTWLNKKRWEDELKDPEQEETALDRFEREMEEKERNGNAI